jgi:hypothetical protein
LDKDRDYAEIERKRSIATPIGLDTLSFKRDLQINEILNQYIGKYYIISVDGDLGLFAGKIISVEPNTVFQDYIFHLESILDHQVIQIRASRIVTLQNHFDSEEATTEVVENLCREQLARKGSYYLTDIGVFYISIAILELVRENLSSTSNKYPYPYSYNHLYHLLLSLMRNKTHRKDYKRFAYYLSGLYIDEIGILMREITSAPFPPDMKYIIYTLTDMIKAMVSSQGRNTL